MSKIIAGIYEIEEQIGAGGGGIVYLGKHLRLNKKVVLKADKRTLATGSDALRREVDMLKNLSQTYIPQVYDFVQEEGVVYTIMDYIEGQSLDKLLNRGEQPKQAQIIKWACQLLEALVYLHSREPHGILHGDIKPANIMLRPSGDICLIDFNIALALGEDGAVKVGFSRGYASPEHYGFEYMNNNKSVEVRNNLPISSFDDDVTVVDDFTEDDITMVDFDEEVKAKTNRNYDFAAELSSRRSTTSMKNAVLLDARSDIYSLGATLYHLISGIKPEHDARNVVPLGKDICSPLVSKILQKAMNPDPSLRYQSAEEMLEAFLSLYKKDIRMIRHKRRMTISAVIAGSLFLIGGACAFIGLKQMEQYKNSLVLSEYSTNALKERKVSEAVQYALRAMPQSDSIMNAPMAPQAQKVLTDALGVYELQDGFETLDSIAMPSEPFDLVISSDGKKAAIVYAYQIAVFDVETQEILVTLPIQKSALSDVVFTDDSHIVYAGEDGLTYYDIENQKLIWCGEIATTISMSEDHLTVAAVDRDSDKAMIYRVSDGKKLAECHLEAGHLSVPANDIFADANNDIFTLNEDGTLLAVSSSNGGLVIYDIYHPELSMILYEESEYDVFQGGFSNHIFAFACAKDGESEFGLIDTDEASYIGGFSSDKQFLIYADKTGVYLANGNVLEKLDLDSFEEKELIYLEDTNITSFCITDRYILVATDDNHFSIYGTAGNLILSEEKEVVVDFLCMAKEYVVVGNRNQVEIQILKEIEKKDTILATYDASYKHDEARVSEDMSTIMLFDYKSFQIYDRSGNLICEQELPDAEQIYDQQFRKDQESYLEVIWYDGVVRCYSAKNGNVISEEQKEPPQKDLYEEFYTDKYRIVSKLHEAPEVYDAKSGKLITTLETDAFLTYVTPIENYLITEYMDSEGKRYGLLLDENFETLSYLPYLCDVSENTLIFDYGTGDLRQSHLYSIEELISLGKKMINAKE